MEGNCSTGQSPQWAVVIMEEEQEQEEEEEEEEDDDDDDPLVGESMYMSPLSID